jgi:hypothetical protein
MPLIRSIGLLCAITLLIAGCIVEYPYTSGTVETPVSIALTDEQPVAVLHAVIDRSTLPYTGNVNPSVLQFDGADSRIRVAIGDPGQPGVVSRPYENGELRVEVPVGDATQIVFELTEPRPGERLQLTGTLSTQYGYAGTPAPSASIGVSGLDRPESFGPAHHGTSRAAGPGATLDADHPLLLVPITFGLRGGPDAAHAHGLSSETRIVPAAGVPEGAATATLYRTATVDGRPAGVQVGISSPMSGCRIAADATCENPLMLRWQWTGAVPSVRLDYDVVTTLTSVDGPVDASVETTFGEPITIAEDPHPISAVQEGSLQVGGSDRTHSWFRLRLTNPPAGPGGDVVEVPGTVVVTSSAVGRDGRAVPDAVLPFHFRDASIYRSSPASSVEVLDALIDGADRTVAVPLFAHCEPGRDCVVDFWFEVFPPRPTDAAPVTVTYRVEARVTAFDGHPLTPSTALTLESFGPRQPPDVR